MPDADILRCVYGELRASARMQHGDHHVVIEKDAIVLGYNQLQHFVLLS
jgi:hypothetical protein